MPFVRALEAMKKEFAPREQQIIELQKQITADKERFDKERDKLPQAELQSRAQRAVGAMRKSDQMTLALAEDIERRRREILGKLFSEATAAVKAVAEAGKFDLVLQQATYIRPGIDITDQVLKEMAKRPAASTLRSNGNRVSHHHLITLKALAAARARCGIPTAAPGARPATSPLVSQRASCSASV